MRISRVIDQNINFRKGFRYGIDAFKGDADKAANVYKGFEPLHPEDIADIIHFVVSRPYHVNIADLIVLPTAQAAATILKRD